MSSTEALPKHLVRHLPTNLLDALRELESNSVFAEAMGEPCVSAYLKLKKQQWQEFNNQITQWELSHTLDC